MTGVLRFNRVAATRISLDDLGYEGFHVDLKNGVTNEDKRELDRVTRMLQKHKMESDAAEKAGNLPPELPDDVLTSTDKMLARLAVDTNITVDADGKAFPAVNTADFWGIMPSDIKDVLLFHYQKLTQDRNKKYAPEDFTKPSTGS